MQKDFDAMKHEKDVWTNFVSAAKKVPPISDIKESDRAAVQAALKSYEALSAGKKYDVQMTKDAMDEALMILDHPNISIQSGQVRKALKNGGTSTKRIGLKKGKSLKIKARSSTGAGIIYKSSRPKVAKVTKNGAVKALKKGKVTITVTSKKSTMKVLIKVK